MKDKIYSTIKVLAVGACVCALMSSCRDFIYGSIKVPEKDNPILNLKVPRTKADIYFKTPPVVTTPNLKNPDPEGAFADWATCLIMVKEGHSHGYGMLHGNYVYDKAPWQQEQFAVVRNTPTGPVIEVDTKSTITFQEAQRGFKGPDYFRIIGDTHRLWGLCFYFYDKSGKLINDKIYDQSQKYQIFFTVSDVDDKGEPYTIMDYRWRGGEGAYKRDWLNEDYTPEPGKPNWPIQDSIPSEYFSQRPNTFIARQEDTPKVFQYVYRDTWTHEDMGDGARDYYNIKLLPPLTKKDLYNARFADVDRVGLKGHLKFDFDPPGIDAWSGYNGKRWPETLKNGKPHYRSTHLLPKLYVAVRVMKKKDGNKVVFPIPEDIQTGRKSTLMCSEYTGPANEADWEEILRFNIPVKVFTYGFDTDPTDPDPYEPYYWHLGKEMRLSPVEAFEATRDVIIHGDDGVGGNGFGSWFL
ncbi:hypothetical protein [Porphyromonas cangingivalis]|uniref:Lipoprotein n=1 Tax=Porphyromonas cangingivalis TaxID=36874 RepID=A0A099WUG4_PORCN|nr:hypothetical protein [Porphyromonas cangingivalis]KGL48183.1 hypothetical protein HQ34_06670 [Porphyromonas cangingivalis]KGN78485.1 hypothetical protein HQ35_09700 [Porphyromonas cangingivalis]